MTSTTVNAYYLYICNVAKKDKPPIVNVRDGLFVTVVQHESKVQQLGNCISRNLKLHRVFLRAIMGGNPAPLNGRP